MPGDPRVGVKPKEQSGRPLINVEEALSNRSTCRSSGEKIEKGAHAPDPVMHCGYAPHLTNGASCRGHGSCMEESMAC